ncbi:heat-inducible transcriptional repressor HrcA [bacterium]|nr:heat-inducible transcriptional repressor HrcA [bacterium]MBU1072906.1 heat-inducible transcriptional repressor HrcA [bacterium]MBU1674856.1 heat-inducible transcriptional repressor HrcA [bacterium]
MSPTEDRRDAILDAVVRLYSGSGQPVSSSLVSRWLGGPVSSATVRAVMARLEEDGLLVKPHTSAGRIPTDAGFRAFVNRLLAGVGALVPAPAAVLRPQVELELERSAGTHAMVKALASLLCRLTDSISIIMGPAWDSVRALRLDLYPKEGRRILMVLVLENALVRTGTFAVDSDYSPEILDDAARMLTERVSGRTVSEIRGGVLASLAPETSPAGRCAHEMAHLGSELFGDVETAELELMGVANVLDEPEFSDPDRLKKLVRFLESPSAIRETLQRLSPENEEGLAVWIGSENPVDDLQSFGMIASPFHLAGRQGILAVLGLRRMPYDKAIQGIHSFLQTLNRLP